MATMTSESTSLDPNQDSEDAVAEATTPEQDRPPEESVPNQHAVDPERTTGADPDKAPAGDPDRSVDTSGAAAQPLTSPTMAEPIIVLDPDYEAPQAAPTPAASTLPPIASGSILHGNRPLREGASVEISQKALEQIRLHSESDMRTELGGFLLGTVRTRGDETTVEVRAALPAHSDDHGPIHFTFTADSWSIMHQERASLYPEYQVVGWFHTHPDLGVFYSGDDVVVHTVGFALPWHVGLVVDPIRLKVGWFGWFPKGERQELDKLAGYYEMTDLQQKAITPWSIESRSAVWATYSESELVYGHSDYGDVETVNGSALGGLGAFLGIIGIVMTILIWSLGYIPIRREFNELRETTVAIAESELISANAQGISNCGGDDLLFLAPTPGDWVPAGATIPVLVNAEIERAIGYRLLETTSTGLSNRTREVAYESGFEILGELAEYHVPSLSYGTQIELELVPDTLEASSDFCAITLYVGHP